MRTILILTFGLLGLGGFAQEWQTLNCNTYLPPQPNNLYDFLSGTQQKLGFKINPFDSSVWMVRERYILQFDSGGAFHYYDDSDHPDFDNFADFSNVTFTSNAVYVCNELWLV